MMIMIPIRSQLCHSAVSSGSVDETHGNVHGAALSALAALSAPSGARGG